MPADIHDILKKYWGYDSFRPKQEDIIRHAMEGRDVLALLPTGGGKSLCFQVPGLAMEGMCLVISPLIALMKDQVLGLKNRAIKAQSITSGMRFREMDHVLDNCIYGDVKFLYVSPERLQTELFQERLKHMNISLIAVDEAHCISQWGYDFRPAYLNIASIREMLPDVPVMALTATATPNVVKDIQEKLQFTSTNVEQKSFKRDNLAYVVQWEENKKDRLVSIAKKLKGSGVVYARNRKLTERVAEWLQTESITADFYHAGLSNRERDKRQKNWITNKTQVIVATNAFGMGIDKPDVRFVVHMDIPDSPEAYFQEAGRGGRDGKKAYAVSLLNEQDVERFKERAKATFPPPEFIARVYQALGNYLGVANYGGEGVWKEIDLAKFYKNFSLPPMLARNALRVLQEEEYINLTDAVLRPSTLQLLADKRVLYRDQVRQNDTGNLLNVLLRSYTNLYAQPIAINEEVLAKRTQMTVARVTSILHRLHKVKKVAYQPMSDLPMVSLATERVPIDNFKLRKERYFFLKERQEHRTAAMLNFVEEEEACRTNTLLQYFGEYTTERCGICDTCLEFKKTSKLLLAYESVINVLKETPEGYSTSQLSHHVSSMGKERLSEILRRMEMEELTERDEEGRIRLRPIS